MSGQFRSTIWDPMLIVFQIVAVQSSFYFTFGALLIAGSIISWSDISLSNIFSYKATSFSDRSGTLSIICYVLNALFGSIALWAVVKRTKLCLDFTITCYFFHLVFCWMYNGYLPNLVSWWILTGASIAIMCVCGEFLCLKSELQDIPLLSYVE